MKVMTNKKMPSRSEETGKRIFIVDDHPIVRDGLVTLINQQRDLEVCGGAEDAKEALKALSHLRPDLVIVDITLKDSDGLELTRDIKSMYPRLPVVVLSIHDESVYAERALRAGAQAYLMKEVVSDNIIKAIRAVLTGEVYVSDRIARKFVRKALGAKADATGTVTDALSDREFQVFRLIGHGCKASQIAQRMHLSIKTVETYRSRIKDKLNLTNASELLQYAIKWVSSKEGE
jgi:DNA-binding NarL/FixJ family response regulator